jgi:hypothetical protein
MMSRIVFAPFAPAIVFNVAASTIFLVTTCASRPLPMIAVKLASYSSLFLVVAGIEADARRRHRTPCFDFGWLVAMFWPVSLVWYCFRSRGWRGMAGAHCRRRRFHFIAARCVPSSRATALNTAPRAVFTA